MLICGVKPAKTPVSSHDVQPFSAELLPLPSPASASSRRGPEAQTSMITSSLPVEQSLTSDDFSLSRSGSGVYSMDSHLSIKKYYILWSKGIEKRDFLHSNPQLPTSSFGHGQVAC